MEIKPKAIVVDDEPAIADQLAYILNRTGYQATALYKGSDALEQARRLCPDLVLFDISYSYSCEIEQAINIRFQLPSCRVILTSLPDRFRLMAGQYRSKGYEFDLPGEGTASEHINEPAPLLAKHFRALQYEFELLFKPYSPQQLLEILRVGEPAGTRDENHQASLDESFNELAGRAINEGRWAEAHGILENALACMPSDWQPVQNDGDAVAFWDLEESELYLQHHGTHATIWIGPSYSMAFWQFAVVLQQETRVEEALRCIEKGISV